MLNELKLNKKKRIYNLVKDTIGQTCSVCMLRGVYAVCTSVCRYRYVSSAQKYTYFVAEVAEILYGKRWSQDRFWFQL